MKARAPRVYAVLGSLAVLGYYLLPLRGGVLDVWYLTIGFGSVVAVVVGTLYHRPRATSAWLLFALAQLLFVVGDARIAAGDAFWGGVSFPSAADAFYLSGYPVCAVGLFLLIRARTPGRDWAALIDAAIITTGVASVAWVFVLQPLTHDRTLPLLSKLTSLSSPLGSLLLMAVASRLLLGARGGTRVLHLIGTALLLTLVGDAVFAVQLLDGTYVDGGLLDATRLAAYVLWAVAALDPSMGKLSERVPDAPRRLTTGRLGLLVAATLLAPALTVLGLARSNDLKLSVTRVASALLFLFVIARLLGVVRSDRKAQERERLLREAAAALVAARERDDMYEIAVETAHALAIGAGRGRVMFGAGTLDSIVLVAGKGDGAPDLIGSRFDVSLPTGLGPLAEGPVELDAFRDELGALVAFTLLFHGEPRGAILVRTPHVLSRPVSDALQGLGAQVGLALEGAALTEALLERQSEERFRSLVQNSTDVIAVLEAELRIRYNTPSAESGLGYEPGELIGRGIEELLDEKDVPAFRAYIELLLNEPRVPVRHELRFRHRDGTVRTYAAVLNNLLDDANVSGIVLTAHDVTERIALEHQLAHQAFHDSLTGLPNRALLVDRIHHALERTARTGMTAAVLFIDLDDFKTVNDSLGHGVGDELLVVIGERLDAATRASDSTARFGGDEFLVLLEDIQGVDRAVEVAQRVLETIAQPLQLQGQVLTVHASIGIALASNGETVTELLRNADAAMYTAKAAGKSCYTVFEQRMHTAARRRAELQAELQKAADDEEFVVYYQPLIELGSGMVTGFEALVRWLHPQRGLVQPNDFIPILEETGLIVPVGAFVLGQACTTAARWQLLQPDLAINVNLSGRQLLDPSLISEVGGTLERTGLPPSSLVLEITESILMTDTEAAILQLLKLKRLGVRLAIDDFGTGYSSLSYLRRFPVDILKIAKPFIDEIGVDPEAARFAEAIIRLGKTLSLTIVAEGIELPDQRDRLRELHCDLGQGFLYSRPVPEAEAEALLDAPKARAA